MKKFFPIKAFAIIMILLVSCNEDIMNYDDPNTFTTSNYFETPEEIRQASNAIYVGFYFNSMLGFQWNTMFNVLAAEAEPTPAALPNEPDLVPLWQYIHNNSSRAIENYWRMLYRMILRSNLTIDKAQEYLDENGDDENNIVSYSQGEAYFLRGWAYTQLAFYWGRVPIRTSYDQSENIDAPRADDVSEVWAVAESDFIKAQNLLPDSWGIENIGRATKGAATGFLGKLYLYNEEYARADAEFVKLQGAYDLLPLEQYMNNFGEENENNQEGVFEVQFAWYPGSWKYGLFSSPEGRTSPSNMNVIPNLYSWNDWGNWKFPERRVSDFIYNDENGESYTDPRAEFTFYGGIGDSTWQDNLSTGPVPFEFETLGYWYKKFTNKENRIRNSGENGNNIRLMRYADVLLMRAECKLFTGDVDGCISLINEVRERIGAFTYSGTYNQDQAFDLLMRERQLELMGEQHRFNDLKRWGILLEVMNVELVAEFGSANVEEKHYLFPIPKNEIDSNFGIGEVSNEWN